MAQQQKVGESVAPGQQSGVEQRIVVKKIEEQAERYAAFLTPVLRAMLLTGSLLFMAHCGILP